MTTNRKRTMLRSILNKIARKTCATSQVMKNINSKTASAIKNPRTIAESVLRMLGKKQKQRKSLSPKKRRKKLKPNTTKIQ